MDIYVEKKLNFEKIWPVLLLIIILVAAFFVIKYFTKNQEIEPSTTILATPNIDYSFLTSPAFEALESFPDYPSFQEDEGTSITPGRVNPFAPLK
jgi:hypothetical protein